MTRDDDDGRGGASGFDPLPRVATDNDTHTVALRRRRPRETWRTAGRGGGGGSFCGDEQHEQLVEMMWRVMILSLNR